ncbi:lipid A deacylase LpxR family protein [Longitalea luteola]|uniref:lipid A deacylase LpxR family protein n=1 Tax=Longitalea luteola TaxID=2812563 RepID=UPI001A96FFDD|nr:lipid A deacylase LpxR family protein [Longitalea luteola]
MERGRFFFLALLAISLAGAASGQQTYRYMLRLYEDNDLFNVVGGITDRGYTNGTRLDYFFLKPNPSRFFLNRIMPKAGDSSVNTNGFSLMQVIITPKNILKRIPDRNDYPYSGALFATHTLHSTNAHNKYNWQTVIMAGVMGPPSLARQTQQFSHRLVGYLRPRGWDYQLKADLLLNVQVAAEKQLVSINKSVEVIGGARGYAGTAMNGLSVYSLIRFGKMEPYFNGYLTQFATPKGGQRRQQLYFIVKPAVEWMLTNALIDGGVLNGHHTIIPEVPDDPNDDQPPMGDRVRNKVVAKCDYGVVLSLGRLCLSFTQSSATPIVKGTGRKDMANISIVFAW